MLLRNLLLLDFDGVLNIHSDSYRTLDVRWGMSGERIEFHLVQRIRWLLEQCPDLELVICSCWNYDSAIRELKRHNFSQETKIGYVNGALDKGRNILDFLKKEPKYNEVFLLDDEAPAFEWIKKEIEIELIHVNRNIGVSQDDIDRIIKKIKR